MPAIYTTEKLSCDVLVIGGGVAGCCAAMAALERGVRLCLAVKGSFAQVGIRGAGASSCGNTEGGGPRLPNIPGLNFDPEEMHQEAIKAGLGLADRSLVQALVERSYDTRKDLEKWGCIFESTGPVSLGYPIVSAVRKKIIEAATVLEDTMIVDLKMHEGSCIGAYGVASNGRIVDINAAAVILANGGNAQLFAQNVHPSCCTGDGYAMALRAGASLANMEFMQIFTASVFPTRNLIHTRYAEELENLYNGEGKLFLESYLPEGISLAECLEENALHAPFSTRDRASRYLGVGIVKEILAGNGTDHNAVFLDFRSTASLIKPRVRDFLAYKGINVAEEPIEINMVHQCSNGGICVNKNAMTDVPGLFAAGEVITGTHGADRIGGNMLAQCSVFGRIAGIEASNFSKNVSLKYRQQTEANKILQYWHKDKNGKTKLSSEDHGLYVKIANTIKDLQTISWGKALVVKTEKSLDEWQKYLDFTSEEWEDKWQLSSFSELEKYFELRNLLLVGKAVCAAMKKRKESRGPHYREDFPKLHTQDHVHAAVIEYKNDGPSKGRLTVTERIIDPDWSDEDSTSLGNKRWG